MYQLLINVSFFSNEIGLKTFKEKSETNKDLYAKLNQDFQKRA